MFAAQNDATFSRVMLKVMLSIFMAHCHWSDTAINDSADGMQIRPKSSQEQL